MAANLTGMFQQMNQAINANPMAAGGVGDKLLAGGMSGLGQAAGAATGRDPSSFMGEAAKGQYAQQEAAKAFTSDNPESMMAAAQKLMEVGRTTEAQALMERAEKLQYAQKAKNVAILESGQQGIQEEVERKKLGAMRKQAITLADKRGDVEAREAIAVGALDPAEYFKAVSKEKKSGTTILSKGAILVDEKEGTVIASNIQPETGDTAGYKLSNPEKTQIQTSTDAWQKHEARATSAQSVADSIKSIPKSEMKAGLYSTASEWINGATGTRDRASQLRTQYLNIQKSGIVAAMPSGPQSDNDVRIFSRGFPPENAGRDEIVEFLEAQARIAQKAADYEQMRIDYINKGQAGAFIPAWKARMAEETKMEYMQATPDAAVQELMMDPLVYARHKDQFQEKFGWLPEPNPAWGQ